MVDQISGLEDGRHDHLHASMHFKPWSIIFQVLDLHSVAFLITFANRQTDFPMGTSLWNRWRGPVVCISRVVDAVLKISLGLCLELCGLISVADLPVCVENLKLAGYTGCKDLLTFYCAMLRRVWYCHGKLSVRL